MVAVVALAVLAWMGLAVASPTDAGPGVTAGHASPGAPPLNASPSAAGAALSSAPTDSQNPEATLVAHALAATRAAGLKPDVAYVPRPSATPGQIAEAAENGSAVPLYTGDPAPMGLADYYGLSPNGRVYAADSTSANVTVISATTNTVVATIPVGLGPVGVAYDDGNNEVYVADSASSNVSVISGTTNTVVATIPVGVGPFGVAYDSANGEVYVANDASNNVSVISGTTNTVVATVPVGTEPIALAYDSGMDEVFVANQGSDYVSVISTATNTVVATVPVGPEPLAVAYDSGNGEVYVPWTTGTGKLPGTVSVISGTTNTVVATVPVGSLPVAVAFDSGNGELYVVNEDSGNVSVISGATNKVVATIPVGSYPWGLAYDRANGDLYVANDVSNNVSVISGTTNTVVTTVPDVTRPLGVAYGNPLTPSILNTTSLQGVVDANATGIQGEDLYQSIPDGFSIQMNAVLTNITLLGKAGYQFWAQDIATYFPATHYMILVTNIWNFSAPGVPVTANAIYAHGPHGISDYSTLGYYYANETVPHAVSYPFNVTLTMNSSVWEGRNNVSFSASVWSSTNYLDDYNATNYDWVTFNSTSLAHPGPITGPSNFTASGRGYNLADLSDDFELDVCGPGGGSQVDLGTADATLGLAFDAGNGTYLAIPSAYNYGSDTGETSTGANVAWSDVAANSPNHLGSYGTMTTGPSILSGLWGTGAPEGSYPLTLVVSPPNAFTFFNYSGAPGFSTPFVSEYAFAPSMETDTFYLMPGDYVLHTELAGYAQSFSSVDVGGGSLTVTLSLKPDTSQGVYTPLWAFSNAEVAALAASGGGTPTSPYILYNKQYAPLSSDFGLYNDYSFPVFPGVFLKGTTASVELNNSSTFETYTNDFQPSPGQALPPTNELQFWFWNVSGVALLNDSNITGWFGLENYFPLTYNSFNVVFFASEYDLVANNLFLTQSQGLLMYSNGTFYGPPISIGGNNTVWGNRFVQVDPPIGCDGNSTCLPLLPYNSGLGIEIGEGWDLIYNNLVATPTTAWLLPLNLYTEFPATWTHDVWNITTEPASDTSYAPGFPTIPLSGSVVGNTTQGGNSWWDYGVTKNWANGADNPTGVLPYDENASTLIDPLAGYGSPLPGYPCPEYYCATYIYPGPSAVNPGGDYAPLATVAAAVTVGPHGLVGNVVWGVVVSCGPAKSGGGGPAKSGGGGPAKSGGGGPCSANPDPPALVLADFVTTKSTVNLVLPDGAFNWTPIVPSGYTSSPGGSFVVTGAEPVNLIVPFAKPGSAVVTFAERGLSSGLTWQVTVGGVAKSLTADGGTDSLSFTGTAGSYDYTIAEIPGWGQPTLPYSGTVTGGAVSEPVLVYTQVTYSVTFSESGLPSDLTWQLTVDGIPMSLTTDGGTDSLTWTGLPNGTYAYSITGNSGWHQSALPYDGNVVVNGASVTEPMAGYTQVAYSVTLSESGLPSGLAWQVTVGGMAMSLTTNGATDSLTWSGLPNGTYAYSIAGNSGWHQSTLPYNGNVVVNGASVTEPTLIYTQVTYSVTFWESGLPSGLTWQVTVGGIAMSLTTNGGPDSLSWSGLPNGTYAYSIAGNSGWHQSTLPYNGDVLVNGASVTEPTLIYTHATYSVTFWEFGFLPGHTWTVTVNGVTKSLTTNGLPDRLTWTGLANGTYAYSITGNPGWHEIPLPYNGNVVVNGASVTEPLLIYFLVTYSVTFSESGLPSGLTWKVTVNGVTKRLTTDGGTDSLTWFGLLNGTYTYSIAVISGEHQTTLPYSGNVVVNGASMTEPTLRYT
jgi:YVTN family beta-propeller protein